MWSGGWFGGWLGGWSGASAAYDEIRVHWLEVEPSADQVQVFWLEVEPSADQVQVFWLEVEPGQAIVEQPVPLLGGGPRSIVTTKAREIGPDADVIRYNNAVIMAAFMRVLAEAA